MQLNDPRTLTTIRLHNHNVNWWQLESIHNPQIERDYTENGAANN